MLKGAHLLLDLVLMLGCSPGMACPSISWKAKWRSKNLLKQRQGGSSDEAGICNEAERIQPTVGD
jgi:hypothetical protein